MQYRPEELDELSRLYHGWVIRAVGGGLIATGIFAMTILTPLLIVAEGRAGSTFLTGVAAAALGALALRFRQVPHPSEFSKPETRGFAVELPAESHHKEAKDDEPGQQGRLRPTVSEDR
jgi:hypothetical protein